MGLRAFSGDPVMNRLLENLDPAKSWLQQRAEETPAQDAIQVSDQVISYAELNEQAERLAEGLRERGVVKGDVVALLFENGADCVRLLWALQSVGAVLLPLNLRWVPRELAHVLRDSGARFLLHGPGDRALQARAAASECPALCVFEIHDQRLGSVHKGVSHTEPSADPRSDLEGALALLYTSGTTGKPKGAILSAGAFLASAKGSAALLDAPPSDRWLACMPLFHVGGLSVLIRSCLAGSCAVIHAHFDPAEVVRSLQEEGITGVSFVAAMLERVLIEAAGATAPHSLRCVLLGGGPASEDLLERAAALGYPLAPTYGLTEAASQVATRPPGETNRPLSGGLRPIEGTEVCIRNAEGERLKPGRVGEICVRGPTLMKGYLGLPDETVRVLDRGWLRTGDAGVLNESGELQVFERREDLIVSGGENIYPAEVESVLQNHVSIREVGVVGTPHPELGARPVAWCVLEESASMDPAELKAFCRVHLAAYKVPDSFFTISALPRTASGKLLRRELRSRTQAEP